MPLHMENDHVDRLVIGAAVAALAVVLAVEVIAVVATYREPGSRSLNALPLDSSGGSDFAMVLR